jgi:phosphotransferase system HPr-like phosphotransfer protein
MQLEHTPIVSEKIIKNVWVAKTKVTKPMEMEVTIKGNSEQNAIDKLKSFLKIK